MGEIPAAASCCQELQGDWRNSFSGARSQRLARPMAAMHKYQSLQCNVHLHLTGDIALLQMITPIFIQLDWVCFSVIFSYPSFGEGHFHLCWVKVIKIRNSWHSLTILGLGQCVTRRGNNCVKSAVTLLTRIGKCIVLWNPLNHRLLLFYETIQLK